MSPPTRTAGAIEGRRADTARRRERVLTAITDTIATGSDITAAAIAQRARVDRSFLYRHPDLLERLHAAQAQPPHDSTHGPAASLASLQADLLAAHERAARLATRNQQLERRLSTALGQQAWRQSGLAAPHDIDQLTHRITDLEQQILDLKLKLDERDQDLAAARAAKPRTHHPPQHHRLTTRREARPPHMSCTPISPNTLVNKLFRRALEIDPQRTAVIR